MHNTSTAAAVVSRAQEADELFWSSERDSTPHRLRRNQAVVEALAAGVSADQLAVELSVSSADIERMAKDGANGT